MRSSWVISREIRFETKEMEKLLDENAKLNVLKSSLQSLEEETLKIPKDLKDILYSSIRNGISGTKGASVASNVSKPVEEFNAASEDLKQAITIANDDLVLLKNDITKKHDYIQSLKREYNRALRAEQEERERRKEQSKE